jgi:hypothetical protein
MMVVTQLPGVGTSKFFAEGGYVRIVTDGRTDRWLSPATFRKRARAIYLESVRMRQNDDRYKDERRSRIKLAQLMCNVADEADRQQYYDMPLEAILDTDFRRLFLASQAPRIYTGKSLEVSGRTKP